MGKNVLYEKKDAVAKIILNRPEAFNALNEEMGEDLASAIEDCFDPSVRAVVITGAGRAFCSGGDLKAMQTMDAAQLSRFLADLTKLLHRIITDIRLLPKPVVAAVNGPLGGAGFSIALACDLRFAVEGARFKQAYTSAGLVPDGGLTAFLPAIVGLAKSSELLMLDPVLDVVQARELGIVQKVFSAEEFAGQVDTIAQNLARGATLSYARAKALLNESLLPHLERQLELERQGMIAIGRTKDAAEGIDAFFAKRQPQFTGN
jgi:2-(1,2-epoxy-1,2-dihydrophenyl)acetyl-CoA isomerase